jgi:hypothetical protein
MAEQVITVEAYRIVRSRYSCAEFGELGLDRVLEEVRNETKRHIADEQRTLRQQLFLDRTELTRHTLVAALARSESEDGCPEGVPPQSSVRPTVRCASPAHQQGSID